MADAAKAILTGGLSLSLCVAACGEATVQSPCGTAYESRALQNAFTLFEGASICYGENRPVEANVLLLSAQTRGVADMTMLSPADESAEARIVDLYGLIYSAGGLGDPKPYADPDTRAEIIAALRESSPEFSPGYDPGWAYTPHPRIDLYGDFAADLQDNRIHDLEMFGRKVENPDYLAAYEAAVAIRQKGAMEAGSGDALDHQRLMTIMADIASGIPDTLPPKSRVSPRELVVLPDPSTTDFRQIASGVAEVDDTAPPEQTLTVISSENEMRTSWVADVMTPQEIATALEAIDFTRERVVAIMPSGTFTNASGRVFIDGLDYAADEGRWSMSLLVGILPEDCEAEGRSGRVFAVGVAEGGDLGLGQSFSRSNFPDACPA